MYLQFVSCDVVSVVYPWRFFTAQLSRKFVHKPNKVCSITEPSELIYHFDVSTVELCNSSDTILIGIVCNSKACFGMFSTLAHSKLPAWWGILWSELSKWFYDTSTGTVTGAVPLWFFCWRGTDRLGSWLSGNTVDMKIYVVRAAGA
jgi:hypothetical protein